MKQKVYLACPYTHEKQSVMTMRVEKATKAAAILAKEYVVFSPLTHSHPISKHMEPEYQTNGDFWLEQDFAFLAVCDKLLVLCLDGWEKSYGVTEEIKFAHENNIPIFYLNETNYIDDEFSFYPEEEDVELIRAYFKPRGVNA